MGGWALVSQRNRYNTLCFFSQKTMRMDALIVFRSILKRQSARFRDYAELTILKICEAHKDPSKDVRPFTVF